MSAIQKIHKIIKNLGFDSRYMFCELQYGTVGGCPINLEVTTDSFQVWNGNFIDWGDDGQDFLKNLQGSININRKIVIQDNDEFNFRIIWESEDVSDQRGSGDLIFLEPTIKIIDNEPTLTWS